MPLGGGGDGGGGVGGGGEGEGGDGGGGEGGGTGRRISNDDMRKLRPLLRSSGVNWLRRPLIRERPRNHVEFGMAA